VRTERNTLRFYPQARKLQVSLPDWFDSDGEIRPGKTVTIDIDALSLSPDRDVAARVFTYMVELLSEEGQEDCGMTPQS